MLRTGRSTLRSTAVAAALIVIQQQRHRQRYPVLGQRSGEH